MVADDHIKSPVLQAGILDVELQIRRLIKICRNSRKLISFHPPADTALLGKMQNLFPTELISMFLHPGNQNPVPRKRAADRADHILIQQCIPIRIVEIGGGVLLVTQILFLILRLLGVG